MMHLHDIVHYLKTINWEKDAPGVNKLTLRQILICVKAIWPACARCDSRTLLLHIAGEVKASCSCTSTMDDMSLPCHVDSTASFGHASTLAETLPDMVCSDAASLGQALSLAETLPDAVCSDAASSRQALSLAETLPDAVCSDSVSLPDDVMDGDLDIIDDQGNEETDFLLCAPFHLLLWTQRQMHLTKPKTSWIKLRRRPNCQNSTA